MPPPNTIPRREAALLAAFAILLLLAVFGPPLAQAADFHAFADRRSWLGLPNAADVLTNLPFALWGLAVFVGLLRRPHLGTAAERAMAALFASGLVLTAMCSAFYHWRPDDAGLALDRCGMAVAFAGLLGLAAAGRAGERAGMLTGLGVLALAPAAVWTWSATGNLLPWAVLQFGGMALVLGMAALRPLPDALPVRWTLVIAIYAVAKLAEHADHALFALDVGGLSGHSLKHLLAGCAAWPVLRAFGAVGPYRDSGQNPARAAAYTTNTSRSPI